MVKKALDYLNRPFIETALIFIVSLVISFMFFGQNLNAKMGIIDDHYYFSRGVQNNKSKIVTNFINAPELRSFGKSQRFRVIYSLANDSEAGIFGVNAPDYYLVNILIFAFFIFSVFYICKDYLGYVWASLATLYIISEKYFAHIFTRLGTAESWAMLGFSLFALGVNSVYKKSKESGPQASWKENTALVVGSMLMIGSKENFAVTGVLILVLLAVVYHRNKMTKALLISSLFILLANTYQMAYVFLAQKSGADIYQNDTGLLYRLKITAQGAMTGDARLVVSIALVFIFTLAMFVLNESQKSRLDFFSARNRKYFWTPLVMLLTLLFVFIFNLFFYSGQYYLVSRYSFPAVLTAQLLVISYLYYLVALVRMKYKSFDTNFLTLILAPIIAVVLIAPFLSSIKYSHKLSALNVEATTQFQNRLTSMVQVIKNDPKKIVVLTTYDPIDFEPIGAFSFYLRYYYHLNNKIVVNSQIPKGEASAHLGWIGSQLWGYEQGNGFFAPKTDLQNNKCFNVDFSGETKGSKCQNLGKIWRYGSYPY